MREHNLTEEEGSRMMVGDIIKITTIRQQFGLGARPAVAVPLPLEEVRDRFGLVNSSSPSLGHEFAGLSAPATASLVAESLASSESEAGFLRNIVFRREAGMSDGTAEPASSGSSSSPAQAPIPPLTDHEAAELKRAQRAKDREVAERALQNYFDSPQFSKLDSRRRQALRDARAAMQLEDGRKELLDAIASYQDDMSNSQ